MASEFDLGELADYINPAAKPPDFNFHSGQVVSYDSTTNSYTITLRGSVTNIPGIKSLVPLAPGDVIWLIQNGSFLLIVSPVDSGWHYIGGTGEPAFVNSWANYDPTEANWSKVGFRKVGGVVYLTGGVSGGSNGATAFTLPAGFRPRKYHGQPVFTIGPNNFTFMEVSPAGAVIPESNVNALNNTGILLTGVSFIAEA